MLWRLIGQYPLPVYQGAWNLAQSFLHVYTCHSWCPKSLRLHSGKECPPRLLGGRSADSSDIILFQCTKEPDILHRVSLTFIHIITDIQSHLNSSQESRISSKTPWRTLWRLKGECHLTVHLKTWNFEQSFLNIYICHSWRPKSSRHHSGIKNVLQDSLEDALETQRRISSSNAPWGLKFA